MRFGRPFRAISLCVSIPGLKPWAVFYAPFGRLEHTREKVQTTVCGRGRPHHNFQSLFGKAPFRGPRGLGARKGFGRQCYPVRAI